MVKSIFWSYIAGFLDADRSIYVQLKRNSTYKYDFQIAPSVVFYQKDNGEKGLPEIYEKINLGHLRYRNDGMVELIISDKKSIRLLLSNVMKFLLLKKKQAQLMLTILKRMEVIKTKRDFISVAELIDDYRNLNYSRKRTVDSQVVKNHLKEI